MNSLVLRQEKPCEVPETALHVLYVRAGGRKAKAGQILQNYESIYHSCVNQICGGF